MGTEGNVGMGGKTESASFSGIPFFFAYFGSCSRSGVGKGNREAGIEDHLEVPYMKQRKTQKSQK